VFFATEYTLQRAATFLGRSCGPVSLEAFAELLNEVSQRTPHAQRPADEAKAAPHFTPYRFIRGDDERTMSRVVASLLDPTGDHAQGPAFLKCFLEWLGFDWPAEAAERAQVHTEARIRVNGRPRYLDILILCEGRALAIENKLDAADQDLQLVEYLQWLDAQVAEPGDRTLIYLTKGGRDPAVWSLPAAMRESRRADKTLIERSYLDLVEWARRCAGVCQSPKVQNFLEHTIEHFSSLAGVSNMEASEELADYIVADLTRVKSAFEITEAKDLVEQKIIKQFLEELMAQAGLRGWAISEDGMVEGDAQAWTAIQFRPEDDFAFGIGFSAPYNRGMFFGLRRMNNGRGSTKLGLEMKRLLEQEFPNGAADWPLWASPHKASTHFPYNQPWAGSKDFWLEMRDGRFAKRMVRFAATMHDLLREAGLLASLSKGAQ
jgi:hypothetical protein